MAAQDLCSLSEVRAYLELPAADTGRDTLITNSITPVSDAIMRFTQREFAPATASATRTFRLDVGNLKLDLAPYDLRSVTTVTLHPESSAPITMTATSQYQLHPITSTSSVYTSVKLAGNIANLWQSDSGRFFGYAQISIAGAWGFASVPSDVKQAAIIAVASQVRRDIVALDMGDVLSDPRELGPERPTNYALPAASIRLLSTYKRTTLQ